MRSGPDLSQVDLSPPSKSTCLCVHIVCNTDPFVMNIALLSGQLLTFDTALTQLFSVSCVVCHSGCSCLDSSQQTRQAAGSPPIPDALVVLRERTAGSIPLVHHFVTKQSEGATARSQTQHLLDRSSMSEDLRRNRQHAQGSPYLWMLPR